MQQFDASKGARRLLDIKNMEVKEVKEYYLQHLKLSDVERNNRILQLKKRIIRAKKPGFYEWILAIISKDGKIIGKLEVMDMGNQTAFVTINLPNKSWKTKYGEEALDQFLKICKENHYFSKLELEKGNSTVEKYIKKHGLNYEVEVA